MSAPAGRSIRHSSKHGYSPISRHAVLATGPALTDAFTSTIFISLSNYELHDRLDRRSSASADRDILVTLAVPPNESIGEARQPVETDYAEASQLDEQSLPKPLTDALETVRSELNDYEEIPENGIAIYAGSVDGDQITSVFDDLPVPIDDSIYRHANEFDLAPLEDVTEPESTYGLLVVECGVGALLRFPIE